MLLKYSIFLNLNMTVIFPSTQQIEERLHSFHSDVQIADAEHSIKYLPENLIVRF